MRRAMELMLTNRTLYAAEAFDWGVVNLVYPSASLKDKAFEIAKSLAQAPTHLQVMAKNRFHAGWTQPIEECTEYEIQNVLSSVQHPHFRPALLSFLQGNKADKPQVEFPG
jgi:enoyl-CoA hydratase/carnithine racemase